MFTKSRTIHQHLAPTVQFDTFFERFHPLTGNYLDGGSARVYSLVPSKEQAFNSTMGALLDPLIHEENVFKVTCCKPSQLLFNEIQSRASNGFFVEGLPLVKFNVGTCMQDQDNFKYDGYVVERLRAPNSLEEIEMLEQFLSKRLHAAYKAEYPEAGSNEVSFFAACEMARNNPYNLGAAFSVVADVLDRANAVLDIEQEGNVLFTYGGRPCLADPVALSYS